MSDNPKQPYDFDHFLEKVAGYRYDLRKERQVKAKVKSALSVLGAATFNLIQVVGEQFSEEDRDAAHNFLSADLIDDAVLIRSGKRRLSFMILYGVGSDRELPGGRNERCGQIGAYVHLADHPKALLASRLYIYGNGDVSDGSSAWNLHDGVEAFLPYVVKCLSQHVFQMDLYWKKTEDLETPFSKVNVDEGDIIIDDLRRSAVSISVVERHEEATLFDDTFLETQELEPIRIDGKSEVKPPEPSAFEPIPLEIEEQKRRKEKN